MKLLFASGYPHLPYSRTGREVSADAMIRNLVQRGHPVRVLAALPRTTSGGPFGRASEDAETGYLVQHVAEPAKALGGILDAFRPDAVIIPLSPPCAVLAEQCVAAGIKTLFHATNVGSADLAMPLIAHPGLGLIANSPFTARRRATLFGTTPPVLLPIIEPARYRSTGPRDSVVMINPTPMKGSEIFFALAAARPDLPFLAVESWTLEPQWRAVLAARAQELGNVALWPAEDDPREAYGRARVILMPSIYEETYGRVVAEAQVSGIPALVSDRGALPETLAGGGRVVPVDAPIGDWAAALSALWDDPEAHERAAAAALAAAALPERQPEAIIGRLLEILAQA
jgi:hypothetical protein